MFGRIAVAALLVGTASLARAADLPVKGPAPVAAPPPFFLVNENAIGYHYEFTANNPGAGKTPKNVASFSHFDVWGYGTNFFTVDWLRATNGAAPPNGAPAAPCDLTLTSVCPGYTEIYGLFRSTLGWNQLTNSKNFAMGPLTNIEFIVGADLNTDNTTLGSAKRSVQGGVQFDFATPYKGYLNASVVAYHEWQHDGFAALGPLNPSGNVNFNTTWGVEALYVQPLNFVIPDSIPLTFKSFLVVHGPKGNGELNNAGLNRTTEYLTAQTLSLDVGKMVWGKPGMLSVYTTYRWWKNKFGIDPVQPSGPFLFTVENTWIAGVTMAF